MVWSSEMKSRATEFLRQLADPRRPMLHHRVAVVVAHPDDETAGLGCQFERFSDVQVLHTTDGAPRNGTDYRDRGFENPAHYAQARRAELEAALSLAGVPAAALHCLGIPDQETAHQLEALTRRTFEFLSHHQPDVVITLAYEGGHPDHDATAFAVHQARRLLGPRGPSLVEVPLYHQGCEGWAVQSFIPHPELDELILPLDGPLKEQKRRMLAAHASQAQVLSLARLECERFREAPEYDFRSLPNSGKLLYECYNWQLNGRQWLQFVEEALRQLHRE